MRDLLADLTIGLDNALYKGGFLVQSDGEAQQIAKVALSTIEAAGFRVVPVEPTKEMWNAAVPTRLHPDDVGMDEFRTWSGDAGNFNAMYRAMLAASPKVTP